MEKVCTACKCTKLYEAYGKDKKAFDGLNQKCKACCNGRAKLTVHSKEAIENKAKYKSEWQKLKRPILNERLRERHLNNLEKSREQARERQKRYMQSEKGKAKHIESKNNYEKKNPEKISAQRKVRNAIKTGKLIRPEKCEVCKKEGGIINAHHEDYKRPLVVVWMCARCHLFHHQGSRFHAERLTETASKEDVIVRPQTETLGDIQK